MGGYKPRFVPIQPSSLRILSGPMSPVSSLSPLPSQFHSPPLPSPRSGSFSPAFSSLSRAVNVPAEPMPWVWSCHKCHTKYPLGATRKCLHDGHLFCGGTTVDKYTGRVKRHRACGSEFDYIGWEEVGIWKKRLGGSKPAPTKSQHHCEKQCDFPSACHWKTKHSPKKNANFDFLDPDCLATDADVSEPTPEKSKKSSSKKGGSYIDKIVKAAEKRTNQITTLLSTIEEENNFASMSGFVPFQRTKSAKGTKLPEIPALNGLGLSFPVMDFSHPPNLLNDSKTSSPSGPLSSSSSSSSSSSPSSATEFTMPSPPSSPSISPTSTPSTPLTKSKPSLTFDFAPTTTSSTPAHGPEASLADDEAHSPVSPRRNAWDWTAGDIGIALGSPTKTAVFEVEEGSPDGEMEDHGDEGSEDGGKGLWEREGSGRV